MTKQHIDREYAAHLEGVRDALLRMAGHVEDMIADASRALSESDVDLAQRVVARDAIVDQLELDVDARCVSVLARFHPVASDLRFVTLALKVVTDLERIGDMASHIAERVPQVAHCQHSWSWDRATGMAKLTHGMLGDVMRALVHRDAALASSVTARDDQVDALYRHLHDDLVESMRRDPSSVAVAVCSLSIVHWLERMADHVTNLAEQVIFLVRGEDVRHSSLL